MEPNSSEWPMRSAAFTVADSVRTHAGVGTEAHLDARPHRLGEIAALRLRQITVVLEEVGRRVRCRLDALFVIDVHVQISPMLFGERDTFIVDERGVLDRRHPRPNRILDALGRMGMRFDAQAEIGGFLDGGAQFFGRKLDGFGIAAMGENGAGGKDLDVIGAAVRELANLLPHFPGTIRLTIVQIPRQLDIRRQTGHCPCALADGDVRTRHIHARADDDALGDGIAHCHIVEGSIHADVAHRRESRQQRDTRIGDGRERAFCRGPLQNIERFRLGKIGQVGVAINQPGKNRHLRQIDDFGTVRYGDVRADGFDFRAANEDDLVREDTPRLHIDEFAGADGRDGRGCRRRGDCRCGRSSLLRGTHQRQENQAKHG
jgi:hypothetical protein